MKVALPVVIAVLLAIAVAGHTTKALAAAPRSYQVALIPDAGNSSSAGTMPTSGSVAGEPADSFDQFIFTDLPLDQVDTAHLNNFDTVVLMQVNTADLSDSAKAGLSAFVTNGGKLVIHDSDGTDGAAYSWLPVPARTGQSCHDCGNAGGSAQVIENNTLVSANPADASYVNPSELPYSTDAVGDANVMVTQDPRWFVDIRATNGVGDTGAVHTYASANGLIVYNGFDTDNIGSTQASGIDWLAKLWYFELLQAWNPDGLPHGTPIVTIPATAPPPLTRYVALGDSYSSGEGVPPFRPETATKHNKCHRSFQAYAQRLHDMQRVPGSLQFVACSGAKIANFYPGKGQYGEAGQLAAVSNDTTIVSLTVGGNDVGFAPILVVCVVAPVCNRHLDLPTRLLIHHTIGRLKKLYSAILRDAPHAAIYVLGYPYFFSAHPKYLCYGIDRLEAQWMRRMELIFNSDVEKAIHQIGDPRLHYVDTAGAFAGGELCSSKKLVYMNGIIGRHKEYSFHPTALGQQRLADALARAVRSR